MSISPEELRDYLLGELPADRRTAVEAAVRKDPQARMELESQRKLLNALRALPEAELPEHASWASIPVPAATAHRMSAKGTLGHVLRLAAIATAVMLGLFGAIWFSQPTIQRHVQGWTLSFGGPPEPPEAPALSEDRIRATIREEFERSSARWARALIEVSASAADPERTEAELLALRQEVAAMHADSVAAYEFLNAKHELLKRQLLEFDLAGIPQIPEVRP